MSPKFSSELSTATPIHVVEQDALETFLQDQPDRAANWVRASGFTGGLGSSVLIPAEDGALEAVVAGHGTKASRARGRFHLASVASSLPEGIYRLKGLDADLQSTEALGWLLSSYAFSRYRFLGDKHLFFWLLTNRMAPPAVFALPFLQLYSSVGLFDTPFAVALAHCLFNIPLAVWNMEGLMSGVP